MNQPRIYAIVTLCLVMGASEGICDTTFSGRTVEFRTGQEISGVDVKIKDVDDGRVLGSDTSNSSGKYDIKIDGDPRRFSVTYYPPNGSKWERAGRSYVLRVGPKIELDTAGLTNKDSGRKDRAEQEQHARNTTGYVNAGGDAAFAAAAAREALKRFGNDYMKVADRMGLLRAFQRMSITFP